MIMINNGVDNTVGEPPVIHQEVAGFHVGISQDLLLGPDGGFIVVIYQLDGLLEIIAPVLQQNAFPDIVQQARDKGLFGIDCFKVTGDLLPQNGRRDGVAPQYILYQLAPPGTVKVLGQISR